MTTRGGFAKVFASLWDGTLADRWETWSVFVFMLAHADADGVVDMTPDAIARRSCIPADKVLEALEVLASPDPRSRTATDDGRRIVLLDDHRDWGWQVVNYQRFRNARDEEARREQNRMAKARQRDRESDADVSARVSIGQHPSAPVSHGQPKQKQKQKQKQTTSTDKAVARNANDGDRESEPLRGSDRLPVPERTRFEQDAAEGVPVVVESSGDAFGVPAALSAVAVLPVSGGGEWSPTPAQLDAWRTAFPVVDVDRELAAARAWLLANPTRGKTRRGMASFVQRWLTRAQADGSRPSAKGSRSGADARWRASQGVAGGVLEGVVS